MRLFVISTFSSVFKAPRLQGRNHASPYYSIAPKSEGILGSGDQSLFLAV
jgi:hypothetical protein